MAVYIHFYIESPILVPPQKWLKVWALAIFVDLAEDILSKKWSNIYALLYCKVQTWCRSYLKSEATYMLYCIAKSKFGEDPAYLKSGAIYMLYCIAKSKIGADPTSKVRQIMLQPIYGRPRTILLVKHLKE